MLVLPPETALLVIDVQKAIDHPSWGERNNPDAERNIAALLAAWRTARRPIYHIRHDSIEPNSTYRPGQRRDWDGRVRAAGEVHAMSLANLDGEYCTVVRTEDILNSLK
ncbi:MAG TPA: hypothetical protein VMH28_05505 [Candidatus Acidoferrales bacterium]|nr:hypothetical protein [Candidatus Acidoferrales bacterium]